MSHSIPIGHYLQTILEADKTIRTPGHPESVVRLSPKKGLTTSMVGAWFTMTGDDGNEYTIIVNCKARESTPVRTAGLM